MPQLDKLVEKIQQNQEIILESLKEPSMRSDTGLKALINQQLSSQQIISLLSEIAPAGNKNDLAGRKQTAFDYICGDKRYCVAFMAQGEQVRGIISLSDKEEAINNRESSTTNASLPEPATQARPKMSGEPEINALFRKMIEMNASDLHLTSGHKPIVRVYGDIVDLDFPAITAERMKKILHEIMPEHNISQFEELKDTDFPYEIQELARFRCNIFMDRFGMGAVFRQIPVEIISAEKLGLSKEVLNLCFLSKGLVLVTGPTGSGKSTTLCAMIDYINRHRSDHIITIEDPIEFVHARKKCLINQREVHIHTKSFSNALRAALREDPDIILVGEMRDLETISVAIETAETGHLVFGTLHTTTAASTVDRIIDQFPSDRQAQIRTMLASSLKGVISQTLCKKIGGEGPPPRKYYSLTMQYQP